MAAYLLFSIYEADWEQQRAGDFYGDLGVGLDAPVADIKRKYRRISASLHPDKGGDVMDQYYRIQNAHATLADDVKRFAYDRLGPDMLAWKNCVVIRDYMVQAAQTILPYYGMAGIFMYMMPYFGYLTTGRYWRWLAFAAVLVFEAHVITRPVHPAVLTNFINPVITTFTAHPPYLPFQAVALARKLSITLTIALGQLGPYLTADTSGGRVAFQHKGVSEEARLKKSIEQLESTVAGIHQDVGRALDMELTPFKGQPELKQSLQAKMKDWLVNNTIRMDPMVKHAMTQSIRRRRAEAPAGAVGNR